MKTCREKGRRWGQNATIIAYAIIKWPSKVGSLYCHNKLWKILRSIFRLLLSDKIPFFQTFVTNGRDKKRRRESSFNNKPILHSVIFPPALLWSECRSLQKIVALCVFQKFSFNLKALESSSNRSRIILKALSSFCSL